MTADHAITRKPVLTLYRQRPPEVGVPSENPRLDEPGLVITDFVDRVGDPVGIVAADGSMHRSEALVADGLRALAYAATGGRALPDSVAVTYPAHWAPTAVDALGGALSRVAEWSNRAQPLIADPGRRGDAVRGAGQSGHTRPRDRCGVRFRRQRNQHHAGRRRGEYQPVAPTVRHHDFSGDLIDQALLTTSCLDKCRARVRSIRAPPSAIGSLSPAAGRMPNRQGTALVEHGDHRWPTRCRERAAISGSPGTNSTKQSVARWTNSSGVGTSLAPQRNSR